MRLSRLSMRLFVRLTILASISLGASNASAMYGSAGDVGPFFPRADPALSLNPQQRLLASMQRRGGAGSQMLSHLNIAPTATAVESDDEGADSSSSSSSGSGSDSDDESDSGSQSGESSGSESGHESGSESGSEGGSDSESGSEDESCGRDRSRTGSGNSSDEDVSDIEENTANGDVSVELLPPGDFVPPSVAPQHQREPEPAIQAPEPVAQPAPLSLHPDERLRTHQEGIRLLDYYNDWLRASENQTSRRIQLGFVLGFSKNLKDHFRALIQAYSLLAANNVTNLGVEESCESRYLSLAKLDEHFKSQIALLSAQLNPANFSHAHILKDQKFFEHCLMILSVRLPAARAALQQLYSLIAQSQPAQSEAQEHAAQMQALIDMLDEEEQGASSSSSSSASSSTCTSSSTISSADSAQ